MCCVFRTLVTFMEFSVIFLRSMMTMVICGKSHVQLFLETYLMLSKKSHICIKKKKDFLTDSRHFIFCIYINKIYNIFLNAECLHLEAFYNTWMIEYISKIWKNTCLFHLMCVLFYFLIISQGSKRVYDCLNTHVYSVLCWNPSSVEQAIWILL